MRASELLGDEFPHGTVEGYYRGCKGGHCPGAIACRDVYRRHAGDAEFRALIDQGLTAQQIVEEELNAAAIREQEQRTAELERRRAAEQVRAAEKEQRRAEARAAREAARPPKTPSRRPPARAAEQLTEVSEALASWSATHRELQRGIDELVAQLRVARQLLAAHAAVKPQHPEMRRHRSASFNEADLAELRRLHSLRWTDRAIGDALGRHYRTVGKARERMGLAAWHRGRPTKAEGARS